MDLFFTSRRDRYSRLSDPVELVYFGTDFSQALEAVDRNFRSYEKDWKEFFINKEYLYIYSVLPQNVPWEMVRFYFHAGRWYSIVKVSLEEQNDQPELINPIFTNKPER